MKKILKNRTLIKIIIILIVVFILTPFLPYKCILDFGGLSYSGYEKLKIQNSSQDGLVLIEDCNELGLKSRKFKRTICCNLAIYSCVLKKAA